MSEVIQFVVLAIAAPAAIAAAALVASGRMSDERRHAAAAIAFAAAYFAGCLLVRPWGELWPSRHFHWPAYLALAAGVLGPISMFADRQMMTRMAFFLLASIAAAFVLVPDYPRLQPPRWLLMPLMTGYLFLLAASLEPLAKRASASLLLGLVTFSAAASAALIGSQVSLTYGTGAMIAAAALAGCWIASLFVAERSAAGLSLSYALVVGGWSFIGCMGSRPRLMALMVAPLAPLALWCCTWGPLARLEGASAIVVPAAIVAAILAAASIWAIAALVAV